MLLMLNVHHTRISDMVVPDHVVTTPPIAIRAYRDGFGNWCNRIVAPAGRTRLSANGTVRDTGEPDVVAGEAQQHAVEDLPDEALVFLLGSRYCETDRLSDIAWSLFEKTPLGWARVQAICDYRRSSVRGKFAVDSPLEQAVMSELVSVGKPPFPGNWKKYRETRLHHETIVINVTLYQELTSQIP